MEHSLPPPDQLRLWTTNDVQNWLEKNGLGDCTEAFGRRNIDGEELLALTEEQLVYWTNDIKIRQRLQITKYLNQYREKEKILANAKEKILSIAQPRRRSTDLPPPVPQVDYKWEPAEDDSPENPWGSDFESESDEDEINELNGGISNGQNNSPSIPLSSNEIVITPSKSSPQQNSVTQNLAMAVPELPAQPMIPRRKTKLTDDSNSNVSSATECKSPTFNKPAILPKPSSSSTASSPTNVLPSNSRPPNVSQKSAQRNSIVRPSHQPPPPPVKPQTPEINANLPSPDEYEIPNAFPLPVSSNSSDSYSASSQNSNQALESYETLYPEENNESFDENKSSGSSETSNVSITSDWSSSYDRPKIPPRLVPGQILVPPPLPRKPSASKIISLSEMQQPIRPNDKPVPLPTRISKIDENGNRLKDNQFKTLGGTLKNKLATLLNSDKSPKTTENNQALQNSSLTASALSLCESPVSDSSPNLTKVKSQETLGRTGSPFSRQSLEDIGSVQSRPLPPVPSPMETESPRSSVTSTDSLKEGIENFPWFHAVERETAEQMLKETESGSYIVRPSRRAGESSPYTLSMQYNDRVYHLNIRQKTDSKFALGKEKLNEKTFNSIEELIEHHTVEPIALTVKGIVAGKICLVFSPEKR